MFDAYENESSPRPDGTFSVPAVRHVSLSKTPDPSALAAEISAGIRTGARSLIEACARLNVALDGFAADPAAKDKFISELVRHRVLPRRSTRLGAFEKSKLAILRQIGQHAWLLLATDVAKYLQPGYSVLYYIVLLYKALPGDSDQERLSRLIGILAREGHLTRDFLEKEIRKCAMNGASSDASSVSLPLFRGRYDLLLIDLRDSECVERVSQDHAYSGAPYSRECKKMVTNAVGVCIARLADLHTVKTLLIARCKFTAIKNIFLLKQPPGPDVTYTEVLVIAVKAEVDHVQKFEWASEVGDIDPTALAARLVPSARDRLHIFAPSEADGWCTMIGDANWSDADE